MTLPDSAASTDELHRIFDENLRLRSVGPVAGELITRHTKLAEVVFQPPATPGGEDLLRDYYALAADLSGPEHTISDIVVGTESFLRDHGIAIS